MGLPCGEAARWVSPQPKCFELELRGPNLRAGKASEDCDVAESQARTCACGEAQ